MGYLPFRFRGLEYHPRIIYAKVNWLNDLKLSVGYGITGNQTGLDPYKTSSFTAQMVYIMIPVLGCLLIRSARTPIRT